MLIINSKLYLRVPWDNISKYWTAVIQKVNPNFILTAYSLVDTFENINYNNELMFVDDVIQYIAGFVVRKLYRQITCNMCLKLLSDDKIIPK